MKIDVTERERVFVLVNGRPTEYLGPGRYRRYSLTRKLSVLRVDITRLAADLEADFLALVPPEDLKIVQVGVGQRALVFRKGRPALYLQTGQHQLWTAERTFANGARRKDEAISTVTVEVFDATAVETVPLRDEVRALVPNADYAEVTAAEGSVALRYVDGTLDAVLPAGRHAAWTTVRKVSFATIDLRERLLNVTGQDVLTKDRVSLRLNLAAGFSVRDAKRLATVARAPDDIVYLAMQLAAREAVATRTLDELLADRDKVAESVESEVRSKAEAVGLVLHSFGIKDVILPGEMKALLNRVIEAQKEAEANVILRREETAATRSMAQTAKVLAENPLLIRLKELEAYKDLAQKVGQVHLVMGEAAMPTLQLKGS